VSLRICAHECGKLTDTETCALRCKAFPACFPRASDALREEIDSSFHAGAVERERVLAMLAMLEAMIRDGNADSPQDDGD
jgi:hypothetical protein